MPEWTGSWFDTAEKPQGFSIRVRIVVIQSRLHAEASSPKTISKYFI